MNNNEQTLCIDKQWVARCFAHSRNTYEKEACVQRQVAEKMMRLLLAAWQNLTITTLPERVVEVGCGTGSFSRLLADRLQPTSLLLNDLCPEMEECLLDVCSLPFTSFLPGDAENMVIPEKTQLIASCSTIQWFHHPQVFFEHCHQALDADGWLAFSTFGKENLYEIKELTGSGLYYQTLEEHKQLLKPIFQVVHAEEEVVKLNFSTPLDVLKHLKKTGVTGTEKRVWSPGRLQRFCQKYLEKFSTGPQSVSLTYHPIYIIAKKL
ncbi:biotin synthesis protein BioC [gut metagenome]|uniref:Biotin synthesis protein BioC n=1 Tax=gut metagenome TaxID=749906 RepID=J9FIK5_9ZZZZ